MRVSSLRRPCHERVDRDTRAVTHGTDESGVLLGNVSRRAEDQHLSLWLLGQTVEDACRKSTRLARTGLSLHEDVIAHGDGDYGELLHRRRLVKANLNEASENVLLQQRHVVPRGEGLHLVLLRRLHRLAAATAATRSRRGLGCGGGCGGCGGSTAAHSLHRRHSGRGCGGAVKLLTKVEDLLTQAGQLHELLLHAGHLQLDCGQLHELLTQEGNLLTQLLHLN